MKFRTRVRQVDAVCWHPRLDTAAGNNIYEVREICPGAVTIDSGWTLKIPLPEDMRIPRYGSGRGVRDYFVVHGGHYVVRIDGVCVAMDPTTFATKFEPA